MEKEMKNNSKKKKMSAEAKRKLVNKSFFTISDVPGFKIMKGEMKRDAARKAAREARKANNA